MFDVAAHQTRTVNVPLTCHEAARTGSVLVNGTLNICPTIDGISANPAEVRSAARSRSPARRTTPTPARAR